MVSALAAAGPQYGSPSHPNAIHLSRQQRALNQQTVARVPRRLLEQRHRPSRERRTAQQLDLHTDAISPQQTQLKVTAGVGASEGAAAAAFEAELAFEGVEYGLDPLANATELTEARFLVFAVGTDQGGTKLSVMKASKSRPAKPLSPRMT